MFWNVHPPSSRLFLGVQLGLYMCTNIRRTSTSWHLTTTVQQRLKNALMPPAGPSCFPTQFCCLPTQAASRRASRNPHGPEKAIGPCSSCFRSRVFGLRLARHGRHVALVVRTKNVCVTSCRPQAGKVGTLEMTGTIAHQQTWPSWKRCHCAVMPPRRSIS